MKPTTATTSSSTAAPSPFADELEALTARALDACNRAIEVEMLEGYSPRAQRCWLRYKTMLYKLGRATNDALTARKRQELKREVYKTSRKAS